MPVGTPQLCREDAGVYSRHAANLWWICRGKATGHHKLLIVGCHAGEWCVGVAVPLSKGMFLYEGT